MCDCVNVEVGSYDNQVIYPIPKHMEGYKNNRVKAGLSPYICIDKCLENEIKILWSLGIRTTGCCCGHNKQQGYIGVYFEDIPKMKELGYKVSYNPCRPNDEDSFIPKSV